MSTIDEIKDMIRHAEPSLSEDDDVFKAQVVLLASACTGPNVIKLARFTGYPRDLIKRFAGPLRRNGVWRGGKVHGDWDGEDGYIGFMLDVNVALGLMERVPG